MTINGPNGVIKVKVIGTAKDRIHAQIREQQEIYKRRNDDNYMNIRRGGAGRYPTVDGRHVIYDMSIGKIHIIGMTRNLRHRMECYLDAARWGATSNLIYNEIRHVMGWQDGHFNM